MDVSLAFMETGRRELGGHGQDLLGPAVAFLCEASTTLIVKTGRDRTSKECDAPVMWI